jgi:hypothetical protein
MPSLDLAFMGAMEETLWRGCSRSSSQLERLDRYDGVRFSLELSVFLEAFCAYRPSLVQRLDEHVKGGRVDGGRTGRHPRT